MAGWFDLGQRDTTFERSEFEVARQKPTRSLPSKSCRSIQDKVAVVPAVSRVSKFHALSYFPVTATEESGQWQRFVGKQVALI